LRKINATLAEIGSGEWLFDPRDNTAVAEKTQRRRVAGINLAELFICG
jgi:hypothetical protein